MLMLVLHPMYHQLLHIDEIFVFFVLFTKSESCILIADVSAVSKIKFTFGKRIVEVHMGVFQLNTQVVVSTAYGIVK